MAEVTEAARVRVAKLVESWDWPDPAILEDILALGAEAVPALDELLTPERLESAQTDEQDDVVVYYALELLAALETPAAIPVFVNAYRRVTDDTVEGLEHALLRLGPEAVGPLLSVAADPSVLGYARSLAAQAAVQEANRDPSLRGSVAEGLRSTLASLMERSEILNDDDKDVAASLVVHLAELADLQARPLIDAAFATGCVQTAEESDIGIPMIDQEGVEELYRQGGRTRVWTPPPFLEDYRKRRQDHLEQERNKAGRALLTPAKPPQPVVLDPKLGRNDPCWCGNGKKYKKCHLAQDEKDKVRL
jgi:hypothetical protein